MITSLSLSLSSKSQLPSCILSPLWLSETVSSLFSLLSHFLLEEDHDLFYGNGCYGLLAMGCIHRSRFRLGCSGCYGKWFFLSCWLWKWVVAIDLGLVGLQSPILQSVGLILFSVVEFFFKVILIGDVLKKKKKRWDVRWITKWCKFFSLLITWKITEFTVLKEKLP